MIESMIGGFLIGFCCFLLGYWYGKAVATMAISKSMQTVIKEGKYAMQKYEEIISIRDAILEERK